jgi:hypothetical protein
MFARGPRAGIGEGVERRIQRDQPDDLGTRLVVGLREGDLADDLVTEIAPGPCGPYFSDRAKQDPETHGQAWKDPAESRAAAQDMSPYGLRQDMIKRRS